MSPSSGHWNMSLLELLHCGPPVSPRALYAYDTFLWVVATWEGNNWNQDLESCLDGRKPFLLLLLSALLFALWSSASLGTCQKRATSQFPSVSPFQFHSQAEVKWLHLDLESKFLGEGIWLAQLGHMSILLTSVKCVSRPVYFIANPSSTM